MRGQFVLVIPFLFAGSAIGQQTPNQAVVPGASAQTKSPTAYYAGPDFTLPVLIPSNLPISSARECVPVDGAVTLSGIVDADGIPGDMKTIASGNADIDKLAHSLISEERFKPGTHAGSPVSVEVAIEIGLQTCAKRSSSDGGGEANQLVLRSHPKQALSVRFDPIEGQYAEQSSGTSGFHKIGGNVSPPIPLFLPDAEYSEYARKKKISGVCLVGLIVDAHGMPQDVHVVRGIGAGLDEKAVEAVKKYRFKPAMKDRKIPVPVVVNIEVNFRLYGNR